MLTTKQCEEKMDEIARIKKANQEASLPVMESYLRHLESLEAAYRAEYLKALQRGDKEVGIEKDRRSFRWWR